MKLYNVLHWGSCLIAILVEILTPYMWTALVVQIAFQVGLLIGYAVGRLRASGG